MQAKHGAERVALVDIDVHHGNGVQAFFNKDPTTFYASTHQVRSAQMQQRKKMHARGAVAARSYSPLENSIM